jgi:hypothetical protein
MVDPETGLPEMSGEGTIRVHPPWNVARDPGMAVKNQKWNIISYRINRFDAAAAHPKFAEQILASKEDELPKIDMNNVVDGSDVIFAHLLVHGRTPAVPRGRYSLMINGTIVLDSELEYKDYPIDRMTPADVIDGPTGYSASNDILALEEATDALHSICLTNLVTFGGVSIVGPEGSNLKHTDLAKGLRYFELPLDMCDKLRALELAKVSPDVFNYISQLNQKKEKAVGSVQTSLAQQASAGASGSSMALIQTQAISYNSGTQRSYFRLLSSSMTKFISTLATFADTVRIARLAGKSKSAGLKEFKYSGEDLSAISCVTYELVNPMAQSFGGRLTFAQDLLKSGLIKSPKQYITLATTGQIAPMIQDDEADEMLILEENEWLMEGKEFDALIIQMHADHIKSHTSQITLEMIASNDPAVTRILEHVQRHIDLWTTASIQNPGILIATGQVPLMPPPGMPQPEEGQGQPEQAPGQEGPPPEEPSNEELNNVGSPAIQKAQEVREPSLPTIAGTDNKPTIPGVTDQGMAF